MISFAKTDEGHSIRTARTLLRPWRPSDLEPFARMNADPEVMEHFEAPVTRAQSDASAARFSDHITAHGYGFWAVEIPGVAEFVGFVGLLPVEFVADFTPAVEIGWRLGRPYWRHGYASEAARGAARFGFDVLGLREIVAYTVPANVRSRAVMTRIGMVHDPAGDFEHPKVTLGHRLRPHVLYRLTASGLTP
ncbi:MAG: GNAT family N-acetyltransferase [Hyphomicrobiales bacterium]|nr:GNAT family N-acetyltransferase [Hyphomicrobiales bacterium]MBV8825740.1 GNAT family N-acetyltransferase [Hyphomicrobiales bacterium]MBV9428496.1 GNAT family N-acetyltransferase [Bradyrhizobiaceae bacterium]